MNIVGIITIGKECGHFLENERLNLSRWITDLMAPLIIA